MGRLMRGLTRKRIEVSTAYILARAFKHRAGSECRSLSLRIVIDGIKLRRKSSVINLRIKHHWARSYHDGYGGSTKQVGFWVMFPKGKDPRRPAEAHLEISRRRVRKFTPGEGRAAKARFGKEMIFFKKRKAWKGDPFFDRATLNYRAEYDKEVGDILDAAVPAHLDRILGKALGVKLSGSAKRVDMRDFKHPDPLRRPGSFTVVPIYSKTKETTISPEQWNIINGMGSGTEERED